MTLLTELQLYRELVLNEYEHAQIIDRMDRQRLLSELQHEQAMEQAAQQATATSGLTGILGIVSESVGAIENNVARLAAVSERALPAIVEHLALTAERLGSIGEILANPTETAAAEFYRRGSFALASGWLEEAISDLKQAVDTYPYHPKSWFNLGIAKERQNLGDESAEAFLRCARYSVKSAPALAATAVLLAAAVHRRMGRAEEAAAAFHKSFPELDRCAEMHLALAIHHDEAAHLSRAFELAPALAADARAAQVPSVESAAAMTCSHEDGPVARLSRLDLALQALAGAVSAAGLDGVGEMPAPVPLPTPGVDCLLRAETTIPVAAERANKMVADVQASIRRLEGEAVGSKSQTIQAERNIAAQLVQSKQDLMQAITRLKEEETQARQAVAKVEESVASGRRKVWETERDVRSASLTAELAKDMLPHVHDVREIENRHIRGQGDGVFAWGKLTGGIDAGRIGGWAQELQYSADRARVALRQINENAQKSSSAAAHPWLQACQDAERATRRAAHAQWEVEQIQAEVADAIVMTTKYRSDAWWTLQAQRDYRKHVPDPEQLMLWLPERWREPFLKDEERLAQHADSMRLLAQSIEQKAAVANRDAAEAENRAAQMVETARLNAERALEEPSREAENAARQAYQDALARSDRLNAYLRHAADVTRAPIAEVSDAIAAATSPRNRIVPFALDVPLELS
jgi:hypothetical protein